MGISLSVLAERSGISKSYLSSIERNLKRNPSVQIIGRIASVLNTDINEILQDYNIDVTFESEWDKIEQEAFKEGIDKEQLEEYKEVIAFIQWKNQNRANS